MTFEESIPLAKQLAENQLKKGFDIEAFLILAEISKLPQSQEQDLVPDSTIDEGIQKLLDSFVKYHNLKTIENLQTLLAVLKQIFSELYHTCPTEEQIQEFKRFTNSLQHIL